MHAHSIAFPEVALPAVVRVSACQIARPEVQMDTGDEFFHFIRNWTPSVFKRERFFSIRSKLAISLVDLKNVRDGEMIAQEDNNLYLVGWRGDECFTNVCSKRTLCGCVKTFPKRMQLVNELRQEAVVEPLCHVRRRNISMFCLP